LQSRGTPVDDRSPGRVEARDRHGNVVPSAFVSERQVTLGFKYFDELSNESTFEGYSLQISIAIEL
jgi:hypothetical protein